MNPISLARNELPHWYWRERTSNYQNNFGGESNPVARVAANRLQ